MCCVALWMTLPTMRKSKRRQGEKRNRKRQSGAICYCCFVSVHFKELAASESMSLVKKTNKLPLTNVALNMLLDLWYQPVSFEIQGGSDLNVAACLAVIKQITADKDQEDELSLPKRLAMPMLLWRQAQQKLGVFSSVKVAHGQLEWLLGGVY